MGDDKTIEKIEGHAKVIYVGALLILFINDVTTIGSPIKFLGIDFRDLSVAHLTFIAQLVVAYSCVAILVSWKRSESLQTFSSASSSIATLEALRKNEALPHQAHEEIRVLQGIVDEAEAELARYGFLFCLLHIYIPIGVALAVTLGYGPTFWAVLQKTARNFT